jgi:hypothetical protein
MAPGIAFEAFRDSTTSLKVLDPMAGSGTALAVARSKGHRAFGVDLDPLAVLLASVWTRTIDVEAVTDRASEVLDGAKAAFDCCSKGRAYPPSSDAETREFIRYWFDDYARRQLTVLSAAIDRVQDDHVREVLWCAFSRLIITKSAGASLAMDLSHSRPHRKFERAPVKPFSHFLSAVATVAKNCPQRGWGGLGPITTVRHGDARQLAIADGSIDLVLTSPPYLNAIDYMRCSKFSLVWMGHNVADLRKIRGESVGAEASSAAALDVTWVRSVIDGLELRPELSKRDYAILARYVWNMGSALAEASRVLRHGGRAVYVVGDSTIRGTFICNSSIVRAAAEEHGLDFVSRHSRQLPANRRYLPPPKKHISARAPLDGRMRREVVLVFDKTSQASIR